MAAGAVAVFGSSEPRPGEPLYERAYRLGLLLSAAGHTLLTGGYGGVMEAASRGARDAGGTVIGVGCALFSGRTPNPYLHQLVLAPDLFTRTRQLVEGARGYVVLPGKSGTLAELAMLWALDRAGCLPHRPVILLGDAWSEFVDALSQMRMIEPEQLARTRIVASPERAVAELVSALAAGES